MKMNHKCCYISHYLYLIQSLSDNRTERLITSTIVFQGVVLSPVP
jgi:hypothetical protein